MYQSVMKEIVYMILVSIFDLAYSSTGSFES